MFIYAQSHPGKRIEELMAKYGIETQHQLADALGLPRSQSRFSKLIGGKLPINEEMAMRLAAAFPDHSAAEWCDMQAAYILNKPENKNFFNSLMSQLGATRTEIIANC